MTSQALLLMLFALPIVWSCSNKRGVAHWADNFLCDDFEVLNNMNWWYDWRCNLNYFHENNICTSVIDHYRHNYVSMIWTFSQNTDYSCQTLESSAILGPNEPNRPDQSNLTPLKVATDWMLMEAGSNDKVLVSPSAAKCGWCDYNEIEWFDEFFALCQNCTVDKLATHTYWCGVNKTMDYLEFLYNRYNKPIWLTEFACRQDNNNPDRVLEFVQGILPRLEDAHFIEKYAWFMARISHDDDWVQSSASLFEANSSTLTPVGEFYNSYVHQ